MLRTNFTNFLVLLFLIFLSCESGDEAEEVDPCSTTRIQVSPSALQEPSVSASNGVIEVTATGSSVGEYQFSLNDTLYQNFNQFTGLKAGDYSVYVRDANNCRSFVNFTLAESPAIFLLSPSNEEVVTAPFELTFQLHNFSPLTEGGNKIVLYIDDAQSGIIYDESKHQIESLEEGTHEIKLVLAEGNNELSFADSIQVIVERETYLVTVISGDGSGEYKLGDIVVASAKDPEKGDVFSYWSGDSAFLSDSTRSPISFLMPSRDLTLEANYEALSYQKHVKPFFERECKSCHNTDSAEGDFSTYEKQKEQANNIRVSLEACSMPPNSSCLPQDQVNMIISWIEAGMPNN